LKHILKTISKVLGIPVQFVSDCVGEEAENAAANFKAGEVLLL
jgi:phosphoglycerate kinase